MSYKKNVYEHKKRSREEKRGGFSENGKEGWSRKEEGGGGYRGCSGQKLGTLMIKRPKKIRQISYTADWTGTKNTKGEHWGNEKEWSMKKREWKDWSSNSDGGIWEW